MDKVVSGGIAGGIAGLLVGLLSKILSKVKLCQLCLIKIGGGLSNQAMLAENSALLWQVIGWLSHLLISMVLGIIFLYLLHYTGKEYILLKGVMFGAVVWLVDITIISPLLGFIPARSRPLDLLILLAYHIIFGYLAAVLSRRFAKTTAQA
ncbi:MAG TPA: DUF6789 family protein [Oscillospiraceae bacterium]|nr:DUF6789 family protein [Oscillospiraceae bacterium]